MTYASFIIMITKTIHYIYLLHYIYLRRNIDLFLLTGMRSFGLAGTNPCFGVCPLNSNIDLLCVIQQLKSLLSPQNQMHHLCVGLDSSIMVQGVRNVLRILSGIVILKSLLLTFIRLNWWSWFLYSVRAFFCNFVVSPLRWNCFVCLIMIIGYHF